MGYTCGNVEFPLSGFRFPGGLRLQALNLGTLLKLMCFSIELGLRASAARVKAEENGTERNTAQEEKRII